MACGSYWLLTGEPLQHSVSSKQWKTPAVSVKVIAASAKQQALQCNTKQCLLAVLTGRNPEDKLFLTKVALCGKRWIGHDHQNSIENINHDKGIEPVDLRGNLLPEPRELSEYCRSYKCSFHQKRQYSESSIVICRSIAFFWHRGSDGNQLSWKNRPSSLEDEMVLRWGENWRSKSNPICTRYFNLTIIGYLPDSEGGRKIAATASNYAHQMDMSGGPCLPLTRSELFRLKELLTDGPRNFNFNALEPSGSAYLQWQRHHLWAHHVFICPDDINWWSKQFFCVSFFSPDYYATNINAKFFSAATGSSTSILLSGCWKFGWNSSATVSANTIAVEWR